MIDSQPAIEIKDLCIRYDDQEVLNNFSLKLASGEKITLTGPSGSGKSSVLRCILGLVVPASGSISILGEPINDHNTSCCIILSQTDRQLEWLIELGGSRLQVRIS